MRTFQCWTDRGTRVEVISGQGGHHAQYAIRDWLHMRGVEALQRGHAGCQSDVLAHSEVVQRARKWRQSAASRPVPACRCIDDLNSRQRSHHAQDDVRSKYPMRGDGTLQSGRCLANLADPQLADWIPLHGFHATGAQECPKLLQPIHGNGVGAACSLLGLQLDGNVSCPAGWMLTPDFDMLLNGAQKRELGRGMGSGEGNHLPCAAQVHNPYSSGHNIMNGTWNLRRMAGQVV